MVQFGGFPSLTHSEPTHDESVNLDAVVHQTPVYICGREIAIAKLNAVCFRHEQLGSEWEEHGKTWRPFRPTRNPKPKPNSPNGSESEALSPLTPETKEVRSPKGVWGNLGRFFRLYYGLFINFEQGFVGNGLLFSHGRRAVDGLHVHWMDRRMPVILLLHFTLPTAGRGLQGGLPPGQLPMCLWARWVGWLSAIKRNGNASLGCGGDGAMLRHAAAEHRTIAIPCQNAENKFVMPSVKSSPGDLHGVV